MNRTADTHTFPVVGVGASAGGLDPIQAFFGQIPPATGAAFVVVQHLSPDFKSLMDELLARYTAMPIHVASDGMPIEPDHVYLIPARRELRLENDRLCLGEIDQGRGPHALIDRFFETLARSRGRDAIAIVLSGTGTDGTRGIEAVKEHGGVVLVQDPATAGFAGMPTSAIETGLPDAVLSPTELGERVMRYLADPRLDVLLDGGPRVDPSAEPYDTILEVLRSGFGVDFRLYKSSTILRRIERRMHIRRVDSIEAYLEELRASDDEQRALYRDLLIGVTSFFRDPDVFQILAEEALPAIIETRTASEPLRVWVPGCASGEEAISIAILLDELRRKRFPDLEYKIFATDLDAQTIGRASSALYSEAIEGQLGEERLATYFDPIESGYRLRPVIRDRIVFAQHDLVRDPPFTRMDLVSCRNVLIYFRDDLQRRVLSLLDFATVPQGLLLLGPSESLGDLSPRFQAISPRWKLFQKTHGENRPLDAELLHRGAKLGSLGVPVHVRVATPAPAADRLDYTRVASELASEFTRMCLVLDTGFHVRYVLGESAGLLRVPVGSASYDVFRLLDGDLRLAVGTALHRAEKTKGESLCRDVVVEGVRRPLDVKVRFLPGRGPLPSGYLVLFLEAGTFTGLRTANRDDETSMDVFDAAQQRDARIEQLENELGATREHLQATVEEIETANEELQSTNEELLAANEELQSTNEELHSVNEELYTVNSEHQSKIRELTVLNTDIENLFQNLDIGIIFLDQDLRVRKYTETATRIVNLLPQDIGRPLEHLHHGLEGVKLHQRTREAIASGQVHEQRVCSHDGTWHFLRILPYRDARDAVQGAVLTLVDLTEVTAAEGSQMRAEERFEQFAQHIAEVFWMTDATGEHLLYVNGNYERTWGVAPREEGVRALFRGAAREDRARIDALLATAQWHDLDLEYRVRTHDGTEKWLHNRAFVIPDGNGGVRRVAGIVADITERKRSEEGMRHLAAIVASSTDGILGTDPDGRILSWNQGAERIFGCTASEAIGRHISFLYGEESTDAAGVLALFERLAREGTVREHVTTHHHANGQHVHIELTHSIMRDEQQLVTGYACIVRDVTDRHRRETELRELTETLERQANHDPLTGMLNRRGLEKTLFAEIERNRREGQRMAAVLIDCDNFKRVNDTLGHSVGDVVLQEIGKRLRAALRPSDFCGRIGGDEFMVLLPNTRLAESLQLAERLRIVVAETPLQLKESLIGITASLGVSMVPTDVLSIEEIVSHSQHALSRSKKAGKNRVSSGRNEHGHTEASTAADSVDAVRLLTTEKSFRTVVQPIRDLGGGRVVAYELLTRGPQGSYERPDDFFRISIENNILTTVDLLCAKTGLNWVRQHANGVNYHINLFPSTILDTPVDRLEQMFDVLGDPSRFCVEISEQQFIGDAAYLREPIDRLKRIGVRVALDDVGFGRSSLESLILLEPDVIKIDRSFVAGAHVDEARRRSLERLVHLGRSLNTELVAEGIENEGEVELLVEMGVGLGQGFLWGEPD